MNMSHNGSSMDDNIRRRLRQADPAILGSRIKAARLATGLTQGETLDGKASTPYLSRIEAGQRRPDVALLEHLADRLGTTVDALLGPADANPRRDALELALVHAQLALASGDIQGAGTQARELLDDPTTAEAPAVRRGARMVEAQVAARRGHTEEAMSILRELVAAETRDDVWTDASVELSNAYREAGDLRRAARVAEDAANELAQRGLGGSAEAIRLTLCAAAAEYEAGGVAYAVQLCRDAVEAADALGSEEARAAAYWNASVIESHRGDVRVAISLAQRALASFQHAGDAHRAARLRTQLGTYLLRLDQPALDEARESLRRAAAEYDAVQATPLEQGRNRFAMAKADYLSGDLEAAAAGASAVLDVASESAPMLAAEARMLMGRVEVARGHVDAARARFHEAVLELTRAGADRAIAEVWFELGAYLDEVGSTNEARDAYRNAAAASGLATRLPSPIPTL